VPGGFGTRGTEGMILAARWARENKIPYLGICLGLQIATIEFARDVLNKKDGNSTEFVDNLSESDQVVVYMPEIDKENMGGTMRLGLRPTYFQNDTEWSTIKKLYGNHDSVEERHRHRYEINPEFIEELEAKGLVFVGKDETNKRCEILELKNHPYYVATQYHPEYTS
ncbi:CTP synthase, partial [Pectobacterium carotovorum subsp. carotovorum]|nr:CTP synthase [Pectobacterium carotovorum subsp. carotovorum]